jgi:hypothetical protein
MANVIAATKLDGTSIDREELARDLEMNLDICQSGREAVSPSEAARTNKKLDQLYETAQRLQRQLADKKLYQVISAKLDIADSDPRDAVSKLIAAAKTVIRHRQPPLRDKNAAVFLDQSVFELFVGVALPRIFEKHFKRAAGRSRVRDQEVDGPFVRFAHRALIELGFKNKNKAYSRETIAKALTLARSRRSRRG